MLQYLDVDLSPDYEAMNDIQRDILMAEDVSVNNDLMKYKTRIWTCMNEKERGKLLEYVHKLNGIAAFFHHDSLGTSANTFETAIKNEKSFSELSSLANLVFQDIDDVLRSRRAS